MKQTSVTKPNGNLKIKDDFEARVGIIVYDGGLRGILGPIVRVGI
jgi:hypothetical protein